MQQEKIWGFFQTAHTEVFYSAIPRLRFLFRLARHRKNGETLKCLNVGAGNGWLELEIASAGWQSFSVDPTDEVVTKLCSLGITAKKGYIEDLPFPDNFFDIVFASEVLEHLTDIQLSHALQEVYRVLRPGGMFIGTVPSEENLKERQVVCPACGCVFHSWGHEQSFDLPRVKSLLSQHFRVTYVVIRRFIHWPALNWKGKLAAALQQALLWLGIHGSNENIVFVVRKL